MKRILIVDNDMSMVELMSAVFEDEPNIEIYKAYDGEYALQVAAARPPPLVVLDVTLPVRDGWSVLRLLKRDRRTANSKVIIVTGMDGGAAEANAMKLGADGFMTKPFSPFDLLAKAAELINLDLVPA
jgi:DNA-binding response OmpR family regulator